MPIDVQATENERDSFEISYGGDRAKITFFPNHMTVGWTTDLNDAMKDSAGGMSDRLVDLVVEPIDDWDLLSNGEKLPVDGDSMSLLPLTLFNLIAQGMLDESMKRGQIVNRSVRITRDSAAGRLIEGIFGKSDDEDDPTDSSSEKPPEKP